ncbi:MAG: hypothetical protein ACM31P_11990 [Actinomycetota bacterium]
MWSPPARYARHDKPSVIIFLPHASAGVSIRRILYRIAGPQYRIRDMDLHQWTAGRHDEAQRILHRIATGQYESAAPESSRLKFAEPDDAWHIAPTGHLYISSNPERMRQAVTDSGLTPETMRYLVCLRDPRDALVSLYFLIQDKTHLAIVKDTALHDHYHAIKEQTRQMTLDEYVAANVHSLKVPLEAIKAFARSIPQRQVQHASYAALCHAFPRYLACLVDFLDLTLDAQTIREVLRTEDIRNKDGLHPNTLALCPNASPSPGRHKRDLQPETIHRLTREFREILTWIADNDLSEFRELYQ